MVEPANLIPYYVRALCGALIREQQDLTLYTSEYQHSKLPLEDYEDRLYFRYGISRFLPTASAAKRIAKGLEYPLGHWQLLNAFRKSSADILHLQWARLPRLDCTLMDGVKHSGRKFVYTLHDVEPLYDNHGSAVHHRRLILSADALIVHSEWARQQLLRQFPELDKSRVAVIEHPPLIQPTQNLNRLDCRQRLNMSADEFNVLFFGSLKAFKGLDFFTNWINQVCGLPEFSRVTFTIAGSPSAPNIEQMIRSRLQDNSRVKLRPEYIPEDEEEVYFKACDIVALPYERISQSGVLSTAFAYLKPVLATGVGNFAEQTDNGRRGISVPADPQQWTEALGLVVWSESKQKEMQSNIADYIDTELNWPTAARRTIAVYERLRDADAQRTSQTQAIGRTEAIRHPVPY